MCQRLGDEEAKSKMILGGAFFRLFALFDLYLVFACLFSCTVFVFSYCMFIFLYCFLCQYQLSDWL